MSLSKEQRLVQPVAPDQRSSPSPLKVTIKWHNRQIHAPNSLHCPAALDNAHPLTELDAHLKDRVPSSRSPSIDTSYEQETSPGEKMSVQSIEHEEVPDQATSFKKRDAIVIESSHSDLSTAINKLSSSSLIIPESSQGTSSGSGHPSPLLAQSSIISELEPVIKPEPASPVHHSKLLIKDDGLDSSSEEEEASDAEAGIWTHRYRTLVKRARRAKSLDPAKLSSRPFRLMDIKAEDTSFDFFDESPRASSSFKRMQGADETIEESDEEIMRVQGPSSRPTPRVQTAEGLQIWHPACFEQAQDLDLEEEDLLPPPTSQAIQEELAPNVSLSRSTLTLHSRKRLATTLKGPKSRLGRCLPKLTIGDIPALLQDLYLERLHQADDLPDLFHDSAELCWISSSDASTPFMPLGLLPSFVDVPQITYQEQEEEEEEESVESTSGRRKRGASVLSIASSTPSSLSALSSISEESKSRRRALSVISDLTSLQSSVSPLTDFPEDAIKEESRDNGSVGGSSAMVLQLVYPAALTGSGQSKKVAGKKRGKAKASKSIAQEHFGKKRRSKRTSATHWDGGDEFPKFYVEIPVYSKPKSNKKRKASSSAPLPPAKKPRVKPSYILISDDEDEVSKAPESNGTPLLDWLPQPLTRAQRAASERMRRSETFNPPGSVQLAQSLSPLPLPSTSLNGRSPSPLVNQLNLEQGPLVAEEGPSQGSSTTFVESEKEPAFTLDDTTAAQERSRTLTPIPGLSFADFFEADPAFLDPCLSISTTSVTHETATLLPDPLRFSLGAFSALSRLEDDSLSNSGVGSTLPSLDGIQGGAWL